MAIRLIAIDLDGTLLDSSRQISPANCRALSDATARGVQVVIVTGRRFHSARPLVCKLPHPVTLIASNGALIGLSSGEILYRDFLPCPVARRVLRIANEYRPYAVAIFDMPGRGQVTMQQNAAPEGPVGWYLSNSPECLDQVPDLEKAINADPVQVMFGGPPNFIEPVEPLLRSSPAAPDVHLSWTKYLTRNISILDVMNRGCSKGRSLKLWAERGGISRDEVMAIGDNFNDLEMLEFAGQPVVMANCAQGLARGDWPVTLTNDQDGVARAIETYALRKG